MEKQTFVIEFDNSGIDAHSILVALGEFKAVNVIEVKPSRGGGCDADLQLDYA